VARALPGGGVADEELGLAVRARRDSQAVSRLARETGAGAADKLWKGAVVPALRTGPERAARGDLAKLWEVVQGDLQGVDGLQRLHEHLGMMAARESGTVGRPKNGVVELVCRLGQAWGLSSEARKVLEYCGLSVMWTQWQVPKDGRVGWVQVAELMERAKECIWEELRVDVPRWVLFMTAVWACGVLEGMSFMPLYWACWVPDERRELALACALEVMRGAAVERVVAEATEVAELGAEMMEVVFEDARSWVDARESELRRQVEVLCRPVGLEVREALGSCGYAVPDAALRMVRFADQGQLRWAWYLLMGYQADELLVRSMEAMGVRGGSELVDVFGEWRGLVELC
jgi:hypothetical protein